MALKVERRDGSPERQVLIGLVVSTAVVGQVSDRWGEKGLFASKWCNLVGGWAVAHYRKWRKAPNGTIQHYFREWAETTKDQEIIATVEQFVASLSDEYVRLKQTMSPDLLLDLAAQVFEKAQLADLKSRIESCLETGQVSKAREAVETSRRVQIGLGSGMNLLEAEAALEAAFAEKAESMMRRDDALGGFYGSSLCRGAFVAFMAPPKRGKSYFLQDLAWCMMEQGRNVAYFEVGDLGQSETLQRFACRASGHPLKVGAYDVPETLTTLEDDKRADLTTTRHYRNDPLTYEEAVAAFRTWRAKVGPDRLKLSCHANSSISINGIESVLEGWARDDWHADAVVIDYADIIAKCDPRGDPREEINVTWRGMRSLSQRRHCLVLTATQTNKDGESASTLTREHFSGDHRKYAEVTGMIGINQTPREKDKQLYRLNWIARRNGDYSMARCVHTAACLEVANPCVLSTF